ncbi:hypothetical protein [Pseudoalteromonas shioyasakiensis]|uniref:hypothetical protein n=1 Tax=Pseudoalteromonas shioyasakiensis TaxID=1190813 RepID=UPI0007863BBE|nr:hypothetical protein [Pseudoalteromonas shioyasakiensis]MDC3191017.1 hypothetical protein [Pseudoalteromonas elyakovii]|tara:strand:+ start:2398 stop:3006 length:609 start_codon:yes stop_codon:yes gene_type:complete
MSDELLVINNLIIQYSFSEGAFLTSCAERVKKHNESISDAIFAVFSGCLQQADNVALTSCTLKKLSKYYDTQASLSLPELINDGGLQLTYIEMEIQTAKPNELSKLTSISIPDFFKKVPFYADSDCRDVHKIKVYSLKTKSRAVVKFKTTLERETLRRLHNLLKGETTSLSPTSHTYPYEWRQTFYDRLSGEAFSVNVLEKR